MKKKALISIFLFTVLLYSCSEQEDPQQKEQVSFSVDLATNENASGGRVAANDLPAGTSLLISLNDNTGNPVLTRHRINLLRLGDSYITDPLALAPGRYSLTDFLLVNDSSDVLFAAPQKNSKLSKIVLHPLPYSFVVSKNKVANIDMEVVDAKVNQPEDFGYAAFNVNVVNPLRISVFKKEGNSLLLTDAKAHLYYNGAIVYNYDLTATINLLSFKGDVSSTYTLVVTKDGYQDFTKTFTYNSLIAELADKPVKAVLEITPMVPTLTYWGQSEYTILDFSANGFLEVDYGNGETESRELIYIPEGDGETNWILLSNIEPINGLNPARVTGDLDLITSFGQSGGNEIDLSALTSLEKIYLDLKSIDTLDLTNNTKLNFLSLYDNSINYVMLPLQHNINRLFLAGEDTYSEMVITNVYNNAVAKNIMGGRIELYELDFDDTYEPHFSVEVRNQLNILRDTYHWTINF